MNNDKENYIIVEPYLIEVERQIKRFEKVTRIVTLDEEFFNKMGGELINLSDALIKEDKTILLDFIPFKDIGSDNQYKRIKKMIDDKNILVVAKEGSLVFYFNKYKIPLVECDDTLKIISSPSSIGLGNNMIGKNYFNLHKEYVEDKVFELVKKSVRRPPNEGDYIELKDGSAVNMWFDVKGLLEDPKDQLFIAYQLGYLLTNAYTNKIDEDGFIVSNNNAWALASVLSRIVEKENEKKIYIVDRLGPSPRINIKWLQEIGQEINGKRLVIVEDLISKGREVDLLYFFLDYIGVRVKRVISLFNLEIAEPILKGSGDKEVTFLSLCRSLSKISEYEYVPKYKYDMIQKARLCP